MVAAPTSTSYTKPMAENHALMPLDSSASAQSAPVEAVSYRLLEVHEWPLAYELILACFSGDPRFSVETLPQPEHASLAGAFDANGELVGFCFLQRILHFSPLGRKPGCKISASKFHALFDSKLPEGATYYAFVPDAQAPVECAIKNGLQHEKGWLVFRKTVVRTQP